MKSKHASTLLSLLCVISACATAQAQTPRVELFTYPFYTRIWTLKGETWTAKRGKLPYDQFAKLKDAIIHSRQNVAIDPVQFGLTSDWWQTNSGRLQHLFARNESQVWDILTTEKLAFSYDDACNILKEKLVECPRVRDYTFDVKIIDDVPIHLHSDCPTPYKFPWTIEYGSEKWESCDASIAKAIDPWLIKPSGVTKDNWPDRILELKVLWQQQAAKVILAHASGALKALPGWSAASASMEIAQTQFHEQSGVARPNLEVRLRCRSPKKSYFEQVVWDNEYEQGKLKSTWDDLNSYCTNSKAVAEEMGWISRWKSGSSSRTVQLYVLNSAAGPNDFEMEQLWKASGIPGLPEYSFTLHEADTPVAWLLVSRSQQRMLVIKFAEAGEILPISYRWRTFRGYTAVCDWKSTPEILLHAPIPAIPTKSRRHK